MKFYRKSHLNLNPDMNKNDLVLRIMMIDLKYKINFKKIEEYQINKK